MVQNLLTTAGGVAQEISKVDQHLLEKAAWNEEVRLLLTIPGVGIQTAMGILAAIGDVRRFDQPKKLASYFGLVPRISQSGESCHHGSITKAGNPNARWLLTEAAHQLALSGAPITASYFKIRKRKGHQKAVVALARKLSELIWHVLTKKEPYRYAPVTVYLKSKLRKVSPGLKQPKPGQAPNTLPELCRHLNLVQPTPGSAAETLTANKNKKFVHEQHVAFQIDKIPRGERAKKTHSSKSRKRS
jgi:hypothetical protein